jgi:hypothetical protein
VEAAASAQLNELYGWKRQSGERSCGSDLGEAAVDKISLPVMKLLSSEAKNSATAAVSDGSPRRPIAV